MTAYCRLRYEKVGKREDWEGGWDKLTQNHDDALQQLLAVPATDLVSLGKPAKTLLLVVLVLFL